MIEIRAASKRYDETVAVDGLSLRVGQGDLFGLIGPNGAGKTTTLRMLATLVKPDAGEILVDGVDLTANARELRRRIGWMPDSFGTFRGVTCAEYLSFFGGCHGLRGRDLARRVADVLELTDLGAFRDTATGGLSMGLRQRLSLAKTLVHDPDILLLDEPASGLDPRARIEIRVFLKELTRMGKTILISSHILADLEDICSDVAIVDHGRVAWQGPLASAEELDLLAGQVLEVKVPQHEIARARAALEALADVSDVREHAGTLEVKVHAEDTNALLHALLGAGIHVLHFSRKATRLEELFLTQTRGIGS